MNGPIIPNPYSPLNSGGRGETPPKSSLPFTAFAKIWGVGLLIFELASMSILFFEIEYFGVVILALLGVFISLFACFIYGVKLWKIVCLMLATIAAFWLVSAFAVVLMFLTGFGPGPQP